MSNLADDIHHLRSEGDLNISEKRDSWHSEHIGELTAQLLHRDAKYFLHQSLSTPCLNALMHCEGSWIQDLEGRKYLDFHGNNVHQVGFSHPHVIDAIKKQLDDLTFCTRRYTNNVAVDLAEKLSTLAPGDLNRVLFAPGGTSAMGMAVKLARAYTGRHKMIGLWDSFHGASIDMISIGGEAIFRKDIGPLLPGIEHAPPPDPHQCLWECGNECTSKCANYIEYILEKEGDVAAVVAETIRSTPYIPPVEYWKKVRAACDKYGALLILDEIPHGLGRTGKMFTFEHYGIIPDMVVVGKGLGGGIMPLAVLIAREHLNDAMKRKALGHYTHEKNPVACAAGLAMIEVIEQDNLLQFAEENGRYFKNKLNQLASNYDIIKDVRGLGLMIGVTIGKDGMPKNQASDIAESIMYAALKRGLNFKTTMGNILTLTPPLNVSVSEIDLAVTILDESISETLQSYI